jgi:20S proteasome subunit beta 3
MLKSERLTDLLCSCQSILFVSSRHFSPGFSLLNALSLPRREHNGGSCIAMSGDGCVAIACDLRLGNNMLTVATTFEKVFEMTPRIFIGLPGLASDTLTVHERLRQRINLYSMKEDREISPKTFAKLTSSTLYERR